MAPDDPSWLKALAAFLAVVVGQGLRSWRKRAKEPRSDTASGDAREWPEPPQSLSYRLGAYWARRQQTKRQPLSRRGINDSRAGTKGEEGPSGTRRYPRQYGPDSESIGQREMQRSASTMRRLRRRTQPLTKLRLAGRVIAIRANVADPCWVARIVVVLGRASAKSVFL